MRSGYDQLPRQEMYWKRREDNQDRMVTALMIKNEFEANTFFILLIIKAWTKLTDLPKLDKQAKR